MADDDAPVPAIELAGRHLVHIRRGDHTDTVELVGRDGKVVFAIEVSERGPVLRFEGPGLTIRAAGDLSLEAQTLNLRADKALNVHTGGDMNIRADGDLHTSARIQTIKAELGDVAIEANDDVRIDGERVLVNC
jgi:adhesin HecA-like repeat protein